MEGAEAQEKVWLFKHPEVELAVPEVLVPDLDGTGSEMHILFLYMACGIVVFSPVKKSVNRAETRPMSVKGGFPT